MGPIWRQAGCGLNLDGVWAAYVCWADDTWLLASSLVDYMLRTLHEIAIRRAGMSLWLQKFTWASVKSRKQASRWRTSRP